VSPVKLLMQGLCFLKVSTFALICNGTAIDELNTLVLNDVVPVVFDRKQEQGVDALYFEGMPYQGKATRIFAYYDTPEGEGPFPAMVLVHGGGGSAYKTWVKKWNDAGFAAISIAVEGQTGIQINKKPPNKWQKHQWAGPQRSAIYADSYNPLNQQWIFHASSAVINAHNLLRSFKEIKKEQIGLSGISWGGVITSTVMGFDQRFAFAIPIYGSGFLADMENQYRQALHDNSTYQDVWEPALRIAQFKNPTFWLTGLKETHFSLDAQANTYKLLSGKQVRSIQPTLKHNHIAGWTPKEPYEFAQAVVNEQPLLLFAQHRVIEETVSIELELPSKTDNIKQELTSATLYYTNDVGHTHKRHWQKVPVTINKNEQTFLLNSTLANTATAWLFNVTTDGLQYSSELYQRANQHKLNGLIKRKNH